MAGSVEKRGDKSWRLIVSGGRGPDGKRIKHTKTIRATSKRAAEKELAKFVAEVEAGTYIHPQKITFSDFANMWFEKHAEPNMANMTIYNYKSVCQNYFVPYLGHMQMDQIKPLHLVDLFADMQKGSAKKPDEGLSESSIKRHHTLISTMFKTAVEWKIIASNPAKGIKLPKVQKSKVIAYDEKQTAVLLNLAANKASIKYYTLIILAITTGLRRAELAGLEWEDIDFESKTLTVKKTLQYTPIHGIYQTKPKTETSQREISLSESVVDLLKKHKAEQNKQRLKVGNLWTDEGNFLFTTWDGRPLYPQEFNRWFTRFIKKHGLPEISFHSLRHTAATLLIAKNVHMKTISNRLGHAKIGTTMDIYGHALQSADQEAADLLDDLVQHKEINSKQV